MKKLTIITSIILCIFIVLIGGFIFKESLSVDKAKTILSQKLQSSTSSVTATSSTPESSNTSSSNSTPNVTSSQTNTTQSLPVENTVSKSSSPSSSLISQLENTGTGNFSTIVNLINEQNGYIQITAPAGECTTITNLHQEGKALVGTGYPVYSLDSPATFYITNLGNNKYEMHEFFNNKYIAFYSLTYSGGNGFSCAKTVISTNGTVPCVFSIVHSSNYAFTSSPYYVGSVGTTNIKMAVNRQSFNVYEQYENDKNSFILLPTANVPQSLQKYASPNTFVYAETYNTVTGYYFLNSSNSGNTLTGVYIKRLANGYGSPESVTLNGATLP